MQRKRMSTMTGPAAPDRAAIEVELWKVQGMLSLRRDEDSERYLYGAQQALEWALGNDASAPSKAFEGFLHAE